MSKVEPLGDPSRHFWMTRSVARSLGVSLSEAMAQGDISAKDYADMVTRCRRCHHVECCEKWLGTQALMAKYAPDFCVNKGVFGSLC